MSRTALLGQREIDTESFRHISDYMYRIAGICFGEQKRALVGGRLARRLEATGCADFRSYVALAFGRHSCDETRIAIDLLTTNETHFFREPSHFEALRERLHAQPEGERFRLWSAACSSGEEPYSLAMLLTDALGEAAEWEIVASDLSTRVLDQARRGLYPLERAEEIPKAYLRRHCLKGVGSQTGTFVVDAPLRARVDFIHLNLIAPLPKLGQFDVIFLRNVMIYFDTETRRDVVRRVADCLKPGGWLVVGHSEALHGVDTRLRALAPSIYCRP